MKTIKFSVTEVYQHKVPDGATHYAGDVTSDLEWYKMTVVGAAGEHWWLWNYSTGDWRLFSHTRPSYIKEIPGDAS